MSGKITKLKVQKRDQNRVNVYLDGRFAFGLAAVEAARLRVGQALSDEEIARLRQRDAVEKAANKAMNFLSYRPRSQGEVRQRLRKKEYDEETIEETVDRLNRAGLLDDREFARYWVDNRFRFNPRGKAVLRRELGQKRIIDEIIEEVLEDYDEEDAAERAAEAGARRLHRYDDELAFRRKLTDYLRRRGFPYAVVEPIVTDIVAKRTLEGSFQGNEG
jgi:regulatory protein